MRKKKATKKILGVGIMCIFLANTQPANAIVWPVIDMIEIASFTNSITTGLNQIETAIDQIENYTNTLTAIGDQADSIVKYAIDLEGMMTNMKDQIDNISKIPVKSITNVSTIFSKVNTQTKSNQAKKNTIEKIIEDTNNASEDGSDKNDLIENIKDEKKGYQDEVADNKDLFSEARMAIKTNLQTASLAVNDLVTVVTEQSRLENNVKQELFNDAELIKSKIKNLEQESVIILSDAEKNYAAENTKIIDAYDNYTKAVDDYFAKEITKDELKEAEDIFMQNIISSENVINKKDVEQLTSKINEISEDILNLKEKILNSIGNDKEYSDEDEPQKNSALEILTTQKFAFNYQQSHEGIFLTGVYSENDKRFLYPKEFECEGNSFSNAKDIEEHLDKFRRCVNGAKAEKEFWCQGNPSPTDKECNPYKMQSIYEGYEKDGVYKHLLEDYSIANIVNIGQIKQYVAAWQDVEEDDVKDKATLRVLKETLEHIDNTRSAYNLQGMIDVESTRLWSEVRRIDAVFRAKEAVKRYEGLETLYLDSRYDYKPAEPAGKLVKVDVGNGKKVDKAVFPNMMMQHCEIDPDKVSLPPTEKYNKGQINETEKNIANCMYKYALGAGRGGGTGDEKTKKIWQRKQTQAMTDTSFDMLAQSVVNNIKSSSDYKPNAEETNIVTLQKNLKETTTARDDYAAGAQINYYSTQQLLSVIEADAQYLQAEIAKDLSTMDYSYFGQSEGEGQ